jgi:peptide/nickel transport system substrate-binding protein
VRRREFTAGAVIAGTFGLAACGGPQETAPDGTSGGPVAGGTLRVAAAGNPTDTIDSSTATTSGSYLVGYAVFDDLAQLRGAEVVLRLAETVTPNADATVWTITLREAGFHDGSPVTADDVLASFAHSAASTNYGQNYPDLDLAASRVVDERTVELVLTRPRADLLEASLCVASPVWKGGDPTTGIGSGAFVLDSFDGSSGAVLTRFDDHWDGAPLLDRVEVQFVADAQARANALTSGSVDYAVDLTPTAAQTIEAAGQITVVRGGTANSSVRTFVMNTRTAPFSDPEVRRALRLAVDRRQLVDVVFGGFGTVGNDVVGAGMPGYDDDLVQREQDVEEARRIFAGARITELTLSVSQIATGLRESADVLAQQLADVGVELTVDERDPATFFADFAALYQLPFTAMYWLNRPVAASLPLNNGTAGTFNLSGWGPAEFDETLATAQATVDADQREELYARLQEMVWADGGEVVWGFGEHLDASVPSLTGVQNTQSCPLFHQAGFSPS